MNWFIIGLFFIIAILLMVIILSVLLTVSHFRLKRFSNMRIKILQMQIEEDMKTLNHFK